MHTYEEMIQTFGEPPLCKCGCGNKVNVDPKYFDRYKFNGGYPKYIYGHRGKTQRVITIESIIDELGLPHICGCDDCKKIGRRVEIDVRYYYKYKREGYPQYLPYHYSNTFEHKEQISHIFKGVPKSEETKKK